MHGNKACRVMLCVGNMCFEDGKIVEFGGEGGGNSGVMDMGAAGHIEGSLCCIGDGNLLPAMVMDDVLALHEGLAMAFDGANILDGACGEGEEAMANGLVMFGNDMERAMGEELMDFTDASSDRIFHRNEANAVWVLCHHMKDVIEKIAWDVGQLGIGFDACHVRIGAA